MSCLEAHLELVGGARVRLALTCPAFRYASIRRVSSHLRVELTPVCEPGLSGPYLEIDPHIIWLADWGASNDVYSNLTWNVQ